MKVYTYRYMWKFSNSSDVNFKIVTDVSDGLFAFEKAVLALEGLERFGKEYLHEYDCSLIGKFDSIFSLDKEDK